MPMPMGWLTDETNEKYWNWGAGGCQKRKRREKKEEEKRVVMGVIFDDQSQNQWVGGWKWHLGYHHLFIGFVFASETSIFCGVTKCCGLWAGKSASTSILAYSNG